MKLNYITTPAEQWINVIKTPSMKKAKTEYECPLCHLPFPKRGFENHVYENHKNRVDEAFALLYGLPYPARCSCGKELHYSPSHKGFQKTCGQCNSGLVEEVKYKSSDDAHKHVEQLEQMLAQAKFEENKLKKEEELQKIPLEKLLFPSQKYKSFIKRLSNMIRQSKCDKR